MGIYGYISIIYGSMALLDCFFHKYDVVRLESMQLNTKKARSILLMLSMLVLCVISSIREQFVGEDMARYVPRYEVIAETPWHLLKALPENWGFENGFIVFNKIVSIISNGNIQGFIIASSLFFSIGIYVFLKNYSQIIFLSVLIFISYGYWTNSFNTVRQYMAIAMLAIALCCWMQAKKIMSILLTAIAFFIHNSSIVFIPIFFVSKKKYTVHIFKIVIMMTIVFAMIPHSVVSRLVGLTPYANLVDYAGSGESILIILLTILATAYIRRDHINSFDENIDLWMWMLSFAIIANTMALKIGVFERVMKFFLVALFVIVPDIVYSFRNNNYYFLVYTSVVIACLTFFCFILMASPESSGGVLPYVSIFDSM